jgi:iron complex outermembrane recepter protein
MHARQNCKSRNSMSPVAVAVLAALAGSPAARAQEAATPEGGLEEIIVTAQKREQNLQEVPIAVSVVSGATLESTGGFTVESLRQLVPSLNIRKTNTSLNQALFLRGVGTINFAIAAQPSVAFVLDGVVMSSAGEAFGDMYDVERVEVLRGPQGTLYGKNASAGVVNVVSTRPGDELGGYVDLGWYEDNEVRLKAALDAPISDKLRTRTTATWGNFDGYIDNISDTPAGGDLNGYDRWGVRTIWEADPTDDIRLTFIGDYRKSDDNCCVEVIAGPLSGGQAAAVAKLLEGTDYSAGFSSRKVRQNLAMTSEEEAWGLSLQADIGLGDYTLTSITAYRTWDSTEIREGDWLDAGPAYVGINQLHDYGPQEQDTFSQELRIASPGGQFIDYVAGLYYATTSADRYFQRDTEVCRSSTLAPDATGLRPCTPAASVIEFPSANADFSADFDNFAVFGDGTINVTDRLRLIAGLRWTWDDLEFEHTYNFSPITGPGIRSSADPTETECNGVVSLCPGNTRTISDSNSSDEGSGRAGVQFDFTDDFMAYATYARGYKGPAYNVFFNMRARDAQVLDAETADSYELGFKSTLADGRVMLNAALYSAEYENFQANNFLFLNGVLITTLTNAGTVSTEGFELDFLARPLDPLTIGGGIAYTDAKVDEFFTPPGSTPTIADGTPLPLAPEWKATLTADYQIELDTLNITPGLLFVYTADQYADLITKTRPDLQELVLIPSFTTMDLSVAISDKSDRYRVTFIGRNLSDENYAALITRGGPANARRLQIPREADRYFGVQLRANFGGSR